MLGISGRSSSTFSIRLNVVCRDGFTFTDVVMLLTQCMSWMRRAFGRVILRGEDWSTWREICPVPLRPSQIPLSMPWERSRPSGLSSWCIRVGDMARPNDSITLSNYEVLSLWNFQACISFILFRTSNAFCLPVFLSRERYIYRIFQQYKEWT